MTNDTAALLAAAKAMLARPCAEEFRLSDTYTDLESATRAVETGSRANAVRDLHDAAELFVCTLDDLAMSGTPEWEALSLALDAARASA